MSSDDPLVYPAPPATPAPRRGAVASARHELAGATPHVPLRHIPATCLRMPPRLSFWGNDREGDCVTAEEAFAKACHAPDVLIEDSVAETWAARHGLRDGASLHQVLEWMQGAGFAQNGRTYNNGAAHAVNWTDPAALRSAIYHGPVKLGVGGNQVQVTCLAHGFGQNGWMASGYQREAEVDHCVSLCGYGTLAWLAGRLGASLPAAINPAQPGYAMFTWGSVGIIDHPSMAAITHEAWLRTPTTVVI